jgi:hypothetical protein
MKYEYLTIVADLNDLKCQYKALCKIHHPDLGGDLETMKKINLEYEERLKSGIFNAEFEETNTNADIENALRDIIEKTCVMKKIMVEICGRWVWFTGETYRYKKLLKEYGCKWAAKKRAWYWKPADDKRKRRTNWTIEQIRETYGSKVVKQKDLQSLA